MLGRLRTGEGRRGVAWTLVAALLFAIAMGPGLHRPDAAAAALGAIPLCTPDGATRYVLPDGTLADAPAVPAGHEHACPDCVLCVAAGMPAGLAVAGLPTGAVVYADGPDFAPRVTDDRTTAPAPFALRPPAQGPPARHA